MKLRPLLGIGILLCFGFMSVNVVQAPWTFTTTEWQDQYTLPVGEFMSWGANHTDGDKWNITCHVVGTGFINFYIFSQSNYEIYLSQSGFAFAWELFEHVHNVDCELEFTSTNQWWIVIENDYSQNVTIDLKVDLYSWQVPSSEIPGSPVYWSLMFLFSGLVYGLILAVISGIYMSLGRRNIKKYAEAEGVYMQMDEPGGVYLDPIGLEGAGYCILFIITFILGALGISISTIITAQIEELLLLVICIIGGAALWGLGIGSIVYAIIHIRKLKQTLRNALTAKKPSTTNNPYP